MLGYVCKPPSGGFVTRHPLLQSENHYYFTGPPGGVACHGAGAARKTASFSDLRSSSSFAQVIDLIRGDFVQMSNRLKVFTIMDREIAALKLNINQLAGITGVHRQTVAAGLKNIEPAPGSNSKLKLYLITDISDRTDDPYCVSQYR